MSGNVLKRLKMSLAWTRRESADRVVMDIVRTDVPGLCVGAVTTAITGAVTGTRRYPVRRCPFGCLGRGRAV